MKRFVFCMISVLLLSLLIGCGAKEASTQPAAASGDAAVSAASSQTGEAEASDGEEETEETVSAASSRDTAMTFIDGPVSALIAVLGEPEDSSYASSCNGPGEDGELYYADFTVYTYREDGKETVVDVW